jgi:hypothetical protein
VACVQDEIFQGATDAVGFAFAQREQRVIVTMNCGDFVAIAKAAPEHTGILLHYAVGGAHLSVADVVRAIGHVAAGQPETKNLLLDLHAHLAPP